VIDFGSTMLIGQRSSGTDTTLATAPNNLSGNWDRGMSISYDGTKLRGWELATYFSGVTTTYPLEATVSASGSPYVGIAVKDNSGRADFRAIYAFKSNCCGPGCQPCKNYVWPPTLHIDTAGSDCDFNGSYTVDLIYQCLQHADPAYSVYYGEFPIDPPSGTLTITVTIYHSQIDSGSPPTGMTCQRSLKVVLETITGVPGGYALVTFEKFDFV